MSSPPRGQWRLDEENAWTFDLFGWIHLPGLMSDEELATTLHELDAMAEGVVELDPEAECWRQLESHAGLREHMELLCGGYEAPVYAHAARSEEIAHRLDKLPSLLAQPGECRPDCV